MKMILAFIMTIFALQANAQESTMDSVMNKNRSNRLSVGGYGEVAFKLMVNTLFEPVETPPAPKV